jgi:lambda family phage portal protein
MIRLGVEFDAMGKPLAYHLRQYHDPARAYTAGNGRTYVRVPAAEIVHGFSADHVGQLRGYPPISTSMARLKMLDGYFEAAMTAARAGAAKMGFVNTPTGEEYEGDGEDSTGNRVTDFEAGVIEELAAGQTFTAFDPRYPHEQFGAFVKTCLQTISGSLGPGVSYSALSGDLEGVNYSSIRTGVLEEREAWKAIQQFFIEAFCHPIYERWLTMALTSGQIFVVPPREGGPRPVPLKAGMESKLRAVSWQPRRWSWVDPAKDMSSAVEAINNCLTTRSAVIREQGRDPDDVFRELAAENAKMALAGIVPTPGNQTPAAPDNNGGTDAE